MIDVNPQPQHRWLQKLVGEWTFESEAIMGPDQPPMKSSGTERVRALGELWIVCDGQGTMPDGAPATMMMTLGFDPAKKRFVGTWVGSMMSQMWIYSGELDEAGRVLPLECEGPSFSEPTKLARFRDTIEVVSDEHRILRSSTLGEDGAWTQFMIAHYRRTS